MAWLKKAFAGWWWVGALVMVTAGIWLGVLGLPDGRLHVHFLDVGQGDAILVVTPDGRQILVDGGPSPTALLNELGAVLPFWDRDLDLVVLTHPDGDHITGLIPLLARYRTVQVLDTPLSDDATLTTSWLGGLAQADVERIFAQRGMVLRAGSVQLTVLNPGPTLLSGTVSDANNNAIVLRLDYGRTSVLLTGDAEQEAEAEMLAAGLPLRADVLKAGHHGSNGSSSAAFIAAVAPQRAVIQVGADNNFGHPHPAVLERLAGIEVLRTDQHGRIRFSSDGQVWRIRREK